MGLLEVSLKLGLAYPLMLMYQPIAPIVASFQDTGNIVYIHPPDRVPVTQHQASLGAFDTLRLRVRRECTGQEGQSATLSDFQQKLHVLSDAARAFLMFFETIRECEFREHRSLAGYPVAHTDEIQNNALVRTCDLEWSYNGAYRGIIPLGSHPIIQITEKSWTQAERRLSAQERILPHVSFALDAAYFAESDPARAIIMACAAWETSLRHYLATVAAARDPAYPIASKSFNIPKLCEFTEAARGGALFYDRYGKGSDEFFNRQRDSIRRLPELRNKLLHQGESAIPKGTALDTVFAVLNAVEWLFEDTTATNQ